MDLLTRSYCFRQEGEYHTFLTGTKLYDVKRKRLVLGIERMAMHDFDLPFLLAARRQCGNAFSDAFFGELSGNSFVGSVFAAVLIAVLTYMPPGAFPSAASSGQHEAGNDGMGHVLDLIDL